LVISIGIERKECKVDKLILSYYNGYEITKNGIIEIKKIIQKTPIEDLLSEKIVINGFLNCILIEIGTADNYVIFVLYDNDYPTDIIVCFPIVDNTIVKNGFKIKKIIRKVENLT
jgi:hypothetical protein